MFKENDKALLSICLSTKHMYWLSSDKHNMNIHVSIWMWFIFVFYFIVNLIFFLIKKFTWNFRKLTPSYHRKITVKSKGDFCSFCEFMVDASMVLATTIQACGICALSYSLNCPAFKKAVAVVPCFNFTSR